MKGAAVLLTTSRTLLRPGLPVGAMSGFGGDGARLAGRSAFATAPAAAMSELLMA